MEVSAFLPLKIRGRVAFLRVLVAVIIVMISVSIMTIAREPGYKVLALYSVDVEPDHVHFANDALAFFRAVAEKYNFTLEATTDWGKLNENDLKDYRLVVWLNNFPQTPEQRAAFQKYMEHGGGWLGFHVAGYNDETTKWPWFVDFMAEPCFIPIIGLRCRRS
ncbi:MAG TPA: ThuA domain-containing protein [Candidatus Acidoferrum sp.]|nr:ThuA domain-containing protein [Candidatus Acidoferrum sp.]